MTVQLICWADIVLFVKNTHKVINMTFKFCDLYLEIIGIIEIQSPWYGWEWIRIGLIFQYSKYKLLIRIGLIFQYSKYKVSHIPHTVWIESNEQLKHLKTKNKFFQVCDLDLKVTENGLR